LKYFVQFSYFGKAYHGWQNQPNAITVQELLEKAFTTLLKNNISLMGAGRTDTGVHAKQMFAHFEAEKITDLADLVFRLNAMLPDDIAVQKVFQVADDAHARFDAIERTYEYVISQEKNPFYKESAHYIKKPLNISAMNQAAELLLEYEDFECFSKSNTDVHTHLCNVKEANWKIHEDRLVFTITANRFLRNMVRAIVGTLLEVGTGKITMADVKTILESKDRTKAGPSAPAKGLYLMKVVYAHNSTAKNG